MNHPFKILVIKCPDKRRWYSDKVGKEFTYIELHMNLASEKFYYHVIMNDRFPDSRSVIEMDDGIFVNRN